MLVGPGGVPARCMDNAVNRVYAEKVPGINRCATLAGVTGHLGRVERESPAIGAARRSAVELALIDADTFFIFGPGPDGRRASNARSGGNAVAGVMSGWIKRTVIGDIVEYAGRAGRTPGDQRRKSGKGVGWFGSRRAEVVHTVRAEFGQIRAIRQPTIDCGHTTGAVFEIKRMHAVDTEQQYMAKLAPFVLFVPFSAFFWCRVGARH